MTNDLKEEDLKAKYATLTDFEIKQEFRDIISIPNARTDIRALTRMSVLLPEMEKRGIQTPKAANKSSHRTYDNDNGGGFGGASALIGVVLIIGGLLLSANTGRIFYGAILVGIAMIAKAVIAGSS